ncbi:MAG: flagellar brake protein [Bacillota bacterium]
MSLTWSDFSQSLNNALGSDWGNVVEFFLAMVVLIILILIVGVFMSRKEKEISRRQNRIAWRPLDNQQRRNWFRVKTNKVFEWIPFSEVVKATKFKYRKDCLIDISGGGLCFSTTVKIVPGEEIMLLLDTGEGKPLIVSGQVLRVEADDVQDKMNKVAVKFGKMSSGDRDRIVAFTMQRQRDSIQEKKLEQEQVQTPPAVSDQQEELK